MYITCTLVMVIDGMTFDVKDPDQFLLGTSIRMQQKYVDKYSKINQTDKKNVHGSSI